MLRTYLEVKLAVITIFLYCTVMRGDYSEVSDEIHYDGRWFHKYFIGRDPGRPPLITATVRGH